MITIQVDAFMCVAVPVSSREIKENAWKIISGLGMDQLSLDILITDDLAMRELNRQFLGMQGPTNVLSFPGQEDDESVSPGQLVINVDAIRRESILYGQKPYAHLARLMIHGILHLAGFDHGRVMDDAAQVLMREIANE
ncbi:MAG: rRNA maturation RNase YbeY [Desulfonatronovibrio sp.]